MSAAKHTGELEAAAAFRDGDVGTTRMVRDWIDRVVRQRSWRFRDPDNVTQEVTLRLLQLVRAERFRGESAFRTFVHSIATHVCIDTYRREKRLAARESDGDDLERAPGEGNPEATLAERERERTLSFIYQQLSEECRKLWRWVYFERRPADEVGGLLGITANATRVRVHRCLERARDIAARMRSAVPPGREGALP